MHTACEVMMNIAARSVCLSHEPTGGWTLYFRDPSICVYDVELQVNINEMIQEYEFGVFIYKDDSVYEIVGEEELRSRELSSICPDVQDWAISSDSSDENILTAVSISEELIRLWKTICVFVTPR